jgi:hypothetical protein
VADRFPKTTSTTSQSPRTGKTKAALKNPDCSVGWWDEVESPEAIGQSPGPVGRPFWRKSLGAKFRFPGCSSRRLREAKALRKEGPRSARDHGDVGRRAGVHH